MVAGVICGCLAVVCWARVVGISFCLLGLRV